MQYKIMRQQIYTHPYIYFRDFKVRHLFISNVLLQQNPCLDSVNKDVCKIITLFHHTVEWTSSGWMSLHEA